MLAVLMVWNVGPSVRGPRRLTIVVGMGDETEGMTRVQLRLTSRARTHVSEIHKGIFNHKQTRHPLSTTYLSHKTRGVGWRAPKAQKSVIGGNGGRITLKEYAPAATPCSSTPSASSLQPLSSSTSILSYPIFNFDLLERILTILKTRVGIDWSPLFRPFLHAPP